jgi:hypothetical protein
MKAIKYYIWYFYFCAYWSALKWGEKRNPQNNATGLFGVISIISASIFWQALAYFGYHLPEILFFCTCLLLPFFLVPFVFKDQKVKSKRKEFDFLKGDNHHKKRVIVVVLVLIFLIALNAGVALIRND